jgi:hypothetical protein
MVVRLALGIALVIAGLARLFLFRSNWRNAYVALPSFLSLGVGLGLLYDAFWF